VGARRHGTLQLLLLLLLLLLQLLLLLLLLLQLLMVPQQVLRQLQPLLLCIPKLVAVLRVRCCAGICCAVGGGP
jgi:hypothetical protein